MFQSITKRIASFFGTYPRLTSHISAHSLDSAQLYLGELVDRQGELHKGVCVELPREGWPVRNTAILCKEDALRFHAFLDSIASGNLPSVFAFPDGNDNLIWEAVRYKEEWHGGGGIVGYLHGNWRADHSNPLKIIITAYSVEKLKNCVKDWYQLDS